MRIRPCCRRCLRPRSRTALLTRGFCLLVIVPTPRTLEAFASLLQSLTCLNETPFSLLSRLPPADDYSAGQIPVGRRTDGQLLGLQHTAGKRGQV